MGTPRKGIAFVVSRCAHPMDPFPFPELSIFPSPGQTFICLAGEREERSSWKGSRGQRFGHDEEMKSRKPNL